MRKWKLGATAVAVAVSSVGAIGVAQGEPRSVTAVTPILDAAQNAQRIGTPLAISTAINQAVNQLPTELSSSEAMAEVLSQINEASVALVELNDEGIEALRALADPLADHNAELSAGVDGLVALLQGTAEAIHPVAQPLDVLLLELIPTLEQMKRP